MKRYSVSYFLRRKKNIYITIEIGSRKIDRSIKESLPEGANWTGKKITTFHNKSEGARINRRLSALIKAANKYIDQNPNCTPNMVYDAIMDRPINIKKVPETLLEACKYHLFTLKRIRTISPLTDRSYQNIIDKIIPDFYASISIEDYQLNEMTISNAKEFKAFLNNKEYSGSSQNFYLSYLKNSMDTVIEDFELQIQNPFLAKSVKARSVVGSRMDSYIDPSLLDQYMNTIEEGGNRLIMMYLWLTGASFIDLCSDYTVTTDIKSGNKLLRYTRSKSKTECRVPVDGYLQRVLDVIDDNASNYAEQYNNFLPIKRFINSKGEINLDLRSYAYNQFYQYCKSIDESISPHSLRHSFAVLQLSRGVSMDVVKIMMGHSSVKVTEQYYGHIVDHALFRRIDNPSKVSV